MLSGYDGKKSEIDSKRNYRILIETHCNEE